MTNFKHKVFLLIAKWIPVAVAAGILINNTLAMYHTNNKGIKIDAPLFSIEATKKFMIGEYVR